MIDESLHDLLTVDSGIHHLGKLVLLLQVQHEWLVHFLAWSLQSSLLGHLGLQLLPGFLFFFLLFLQCLFLFSDSVTLLFGLLVFLSWILLFQLSFVLSGNLLDLGQRNERSWLGDLRLRVVVGLFLSFLGCFLF